MTENLIEEKAKELSFTMINKIYLFDSMNDVVKIYERINNLFTFKEDRNLTEYLEYIKTNLKEEFVPIFMSSVSVPKIEKELTSGKEVVEYTYTTLNNKTYTNYCSVIEVEGAKSVLMLEVEKNDKQTSSNNEKYVNLVNALSDSILKIQNLFNLDSKALSNTKSLENYINSLFSNLYETYPEIKKSLNKTAANVSGRVLDTILIVDDDNIMRNMIKKVFKDDNYKLVDASNGKEAIDYLKENDNKGINDSSDHVVGIFLDLTMPVLDGFAVLEYLSKKNYLSKIPVIIISGDYEKETKQRVYNYNIADMLEKPFDFQVVRHRIGNFINLYKSSNSLNDLINSENKDLKDLVNPFVEAYKYDYGNNIKRVNELIIKLGKKLMEDYPEYELDDEKIDKMAEASMYYDLGFYSIPRRVLNKKENLATDELEMIKQYPLFGSKMVDYVLSLISDRLYKDYALNITKYYHECYNGTGYPSKLSGESIPLEARIASICIYFNNLSNRGISNAKDVINNKKGAMFDPKLVDSFLKIID